MATITQSIGTDTRDHSTITLWEADLDDDPTYDAGDDAVGEMYDDSVFDEESSINGGSTIGLSSIRLTVASAERHDGTAGTGARVVMGGTTTSVIIRFNGTIEDTTLEWLELDYNSQNCRGAFSAGDRGHFIKNCIVHDLAANANLAINIISLSHFGTSGSPDANAFNCIVYAIDNINTGTSAELHAFRSTSRTGKILNCTGHNVTFGGGGSETGTIFEINNSLVQFQNCIGTDGETADIGGTTNGTEDHNLTSDTTATGTGSLTEKSAANQFVSTALGSEDLHLKSGADAIDAGTDLGTTPSGVEIDIDDRDRDAEGDIWDMGAHEFVAVVVVAAAGPILQFDPKWQTRYTIG